MYLFEKHCYLGVLDYRQASIIFNDITPPFDNSSHCLESVALLASPQHPLYPKDVSPSLNFSRLSVFITYFGQRMSKCIIVYHSRTIHCPLTKM